MSETKCNPKSRQMQRFLDEVVPEMSRRTEFVQRRSKLTGTVLVEALVWACLDHPDATLNEMVQYCAELGVDISEAGWHQRLNERTVALLSGLVGHALRHWVCHEGVKAEVLAPFQAVNILDSTLITLPEGLAAWFTGNGRPGQRSTVKLQVSVDYRSGRLNGIEVVDGCCPDQRYPGLTDGAQPQSLNLFDLGYFDQERLATLDHQGAYFVTRLPSQVALYNPATGNTRVDLAAWLQAQPQSQGEGWFELGHRARLPVRVIFAALPPAVAAARRRQAKAKAKQRGQTCLASHLALLDWTLLITNAPGEWLTVDHVLAVYPLRWQIELMFKLWKSHLGLATCRGRSLPPVLCHLYAHLLAIIWLHWLSADWRFVEDRELSLTKAQHVVRRWVDRLFGALATSPRSVTTILEHLEEDFQRYACKQHRRKSPSSYQRLVALGA